MCLPIWNHHKAKSLFLKKEKVGHCVLVCVLGSLPVFSIRSPCTQALDFHDGEEHVTCREPAGLTGKREKLELPLNNFTKGKTVPWAILSYSWLQSLAWVTWSNFTDRLLSPDILRVGWPHRMSWSSEARRRRRIARNWERRDPVPAFTWTCMCIGKPVSSSASSSLPAKGGYRSHIFTLHIGAALDRLVGTG